MMSKFSKKISKLVRNLDACVVVGRSFGHMDEVSTLFKTVFVLSDGVDEFRGRNIVYRSNLSNVGSFPSSLSTIFLDFNLLDNLLKVEDLLQQRKLFLIISTQEFITRDWFVFLRSKGYEQSETTSEYQVWKSIK